MPAFNPTAIKVGENIIAREICTSLLIMQTVGANFVRLRKLSDLNWKYLTLYFRVPPYSNILYYLRFGIFFLFEKENACKRKANSGLRPETPANAEPQYTACGSQLVARHIRSQTRFAQTVRTRADCFAIRSLADVSRFVTTAARLLKV